MGYSPGRQKPNVVSSTGKMAALKVFFPVLQLQMVGLGEQNSERGDGGRGGERRKGVKRDESWGGGGEQETGGWQALWYIPGGRQDAPTTPPSNSTLPAQCHYFYHKSRLGLHDTYHKSNESSDASVLPVGYYNNMLSLQTNNVSSGSLAVYRPRT